MKYKFYILACFLLFTAVAHTQTDTIAHGLYKWPGSTMALHPSQTVFKGSTRDFSFIEMQAHWLGNNNHFFYQVPDNEECLVIFVKGSAQFFWQDTNQNIPTGSIALLMPGEKIGILPGDGKFVQFYTLQYRSKLPVDKMRGDTAGGSFIINWNDLPVKTNARGFRRDYFDRATALCRRFEMHVTTLHEGFASHDPHRHPHEEIILNLDNQTEMLIGDQTYSGGPGDFYYLTSGILHGVKNTGKGSCSYFAFRFE